MVQLISIHIPKTAGLSFAVTLREVYGKRAVTGLRTWHVPGPKCHDPNSRFYTDWYWFKVEWDRRMTSTKVPRAKVIHGHAPACCFEGLFPDAARVVWLRNPADMVLSSIFFKYQLDRRCARANTPLEMMQNPCGQNVLTLFTSGDLSQFAFVGIVEHYEEDLYKLAQLLNWPAGRVHPHHGNITWYKPEWRRQLRRDRALVDELKRLNAQDVKLYNEALRRRGYA